MSWDVPDENVYDSTACDLLVEIRDLLKKLPTTREIFIACFISAFEKRKDARDLADDLIEDLKKVTGNEAL